MATAILPPNESTPIVQWYLRIDDQIDLLIDALAGRFRDADPSNTFEGVVRMLLEDSECGEVFRRAAADTASAETDRLLQATRDAQRVMLDVAWQFAQGDVYRPAINEAMGNARAALSVLFDRLPPATSDSHVATPPLPQVDLQLNQVRYDGECHSVAPDAAILFHGLVQGHPHFIAASKLSSKPSRVKNSLPDKLQALIETKKGSGYRLKLG